MAGAVQVPSLVTTIRRPHTAEWPIGCVSGLGLAIPGAVVPADWLGLADSDGAGGAGRAAQVDWGSVGQQAYPPPPRAASS